MFDSSDESRDEEISLAEARRPYQINLNSDTELIRNNTSKCCGRRNKRKSVIILILFLNTVEPLYVMYPQYKIHLYLMNAILILVGPLCGEVFEHYLYLRYTSI
ncbi:unnamed protein product [Meloidogyne enterolobii]|uniref:Uncharacterized protein n=1 Tax=Meloidogyne enterolobii TaxID=390850 RepID=A0ACB0ZRK8_MELEN